MSVFILEAPASTGTGMEGVMEGFIRRSYLRGPNDIVGFLPRLRKADQSGPVIPPMYCYGFFTSHMTIGNYWWHY